jgi:hypothetical protein
LPWSFALENGFPSEPTSVNGPPNDDRVAVACGGWTVTRWTTNNAAIPAIASATSAHASMRTSFSFDFGGEVSVIGSNR